MLSEAQRKARAKLASTTARARQLPEADAELAVSKARLNYKFVSAEVYIRNLVDTAPALSREQRNTLAGVLRGARHREVDRPDAGLAPLLCGDAP